MVQSGTVTTSTTATRLPDGPCPGGMTIRNDDAVIAIMVGGSQSQDYKLAPAAAVYVRCKNRSAVYVKSVSGTPALQYLSS